MQLAKRPSSAALCWAALAVQEERQNPTAKYGETPAEHALWLDLQSNTGLQLKTSQCIGDI